LLIGSFNGGVDEHPLKIAPLGRVFGILCKAAVSHAIKE